MSRELLVRDRARQIRVAWAAELAATPKRLEDLPEVTRATAIGRLLRGVVLQHRLFPRWTRLVEPEVRS